MLYLVSEIPEYIGVRRWASKAQLVKHINKNVFNNNVTSLLEIDSAEYYSELLNYNLTSYNFALGETDSAQETLKNLRSKLNLDDNVLCLLTEEQCRNGIIPKDEVDEMLTDSKLFVYGGYYDQPVLDCIGYDFNDQVSIENILKRNGELDHLIGVRKPAVFAIQAVSASLFRLLKKGVIELGGAHEIYAPNDWYYRSDFKFRLTGQPYDGLFIPPCENVSFNPNQLLLDFK